MRTWKVKAKRTFRDLLSPPPPRLGGRWSSRLQMDQQTEPPFAAAFLILAHQPPPENEQGASAFAGLLSPQPRLWPRPVVSCITDSFVKLTVETAYNFLLKNDDSDGGEVE